MRGIGWRRFRKGAWGAFAAIAVAAALRIACGGTATGPELTLPRARDAGSGADAAPGAAGPAATNVAPTDKPAGVKHVFVVAMENQDADRLYGNSDDAPYINGALIPRAARATAFADALPGLPSEPHYVWTEAGTNAFGDHTFTTDDSPSASNSTASGDHLVAQIAAAGGGLDWMSYQEGIGQATGACPLAGAGCYRPRHNPFVFFRDVSGDPPSKDATACAAHHRDLSALGADLASGAVASYVFVSPNLCNDMHGAAGCPNSNRTRAGDDWLAANLPALIDFVDANGGVVFVTWEEGNHTATVPFIAVGPGVKRGYAGSVPYTHGSLLKTVERLLGLPSLPAVAGATDLSDLFAP